MIGRIWHGWTTHQNADTYEALLKTEIIPDIASKNAQGLQSVQLLRRSLGEDVEFIVFMKFESLEAIKQFAGEDYEQAYLPPKALKVLLRFDKRAQHYDIREENNYQPKSYISE